MVNRRTAGRSARVQLTTHITAPPVNAYSVSKGSSVRDSACHPATPKTQAIIQDWKAGVVLLTSKVQFKTSCAWQTHHTGILKLWTSLTTPKHFQQGGVNTLRTLHCKERGAAHMMPTGEAGPGCCFAAARGVAETPCRTWTTSPKSPQMKLLVFSVRVPACCKRLSPIVSLLCSLRVFVNYYSS